MGEEPPGPRRHALPAAPDGQLRLGHGDRPLDLHRLQRLRDRLPGREQHPRRRQGAGPARPRDALDPRRPLLRGRPREPRARSTSRCPACTARTRRARSVCPVGGDGAQRRGPQRDGLQPLRRHAVLLEQLPVQGAALQLLPLRGLHDRDPQDGAQPRGHGAQPRASWRSARYCVQRINAARIAAEKENRPIRDGEIVHGLPAGLPGARRSSFGDLDDPESRVSKAQGRAAQLRPPRPSSARARGRRTSPRCRTRNPALGGAREKPEGGHGA